MHDGIPYDLIQGQGQDHGGLKSQAAQHCCNDDQQSQWENFDPRCVEMADFKGCLLHQYAFNQKIIGELQYSKTICKC